MAWFHFRPSERLLAGAAGKITRLENRLEGIIEAYFICARELASITGTLISMSPSIGPVSWLMTRAMYTLIENRLSRHDKLVVNDPVKKVLKFWLGGLKNFNSQPIWHRPSAVSVVYSDASDTGYSGYVVEHGQYIAHEQWDHDEVRLSSTLRESKAVWLVLESVGDELRSSRVRWFTDSQNVVRVLEVGSRKHDLQEEVVKVFNLFVQYEIHLEPSWIPSEQNKYADYLSHIVDHDDWKLNANVFVALDGMHGPHTVDRFASFYNNLVSCFNSHFWNPGSEAVDAFTEYWARENNWLCPPVAIILRVLRHAQHCSAVSTLVVPLWKSAPFWPLLCPDGTKFAGFVTDWCELPKNVY